MRLNIEYKLHCWWTCCVLCFPDIDECSQSESVCTKEDQECANTNGSYVCICSSGFEEQDGECVQTPQPGEVSYSLCPTHSECILRFSAEGGGALCFYLVDYTRLLQSFDTKAYEYN